MRVCIVLEGSYPYITGGVSAWVHDLILGLPEIEFVLFTISPMPGQESRYDLPENVVESVDLVLSGNRSDERMVGGSSDLLAEIETMHTHMFAGARAAPKGVLTEIPEGELLHELAVTSDTGWRMITLNNLKRNPLYPFADYFWAWKSAHDMIFHTLGATPPEADIYHAVSTGFAGLAAMAAKFRRGKSFLLTEHGLYHKEREIEIRKTGIVRGYQRDMWINIYNSLSRMCYQNADLITALFEINRRKQLELGAPEEKTVVIPNGIDIDRFSVERRSRPGFHVGLVGRVVPIKDIKTYITAAKVVLSRYDDVTFYCIGPTDEDPGYYEDCKLLVRSMRLADRFEFTGRQNVLEYYNFLDVLLLTSIREAQPLVILEAYAAGVPVVATNVGNIAEMLDYDDRFLSPPKDPDKLAEGIAYVHDHPEEMAGIIERNREKVNKFYDKYDLHATYRSLYEKMTDGGK
jgi:polysaccharide biosynthesis protein PelF